MNGVHGKTALALLLVEEERVIRKDQNYLKNETEGNVRESHLNSNPATMNPVVVCYLFSSLLSLAILIFQASFFVHNQVDHKLCFLRHDLLPEV